MPGLVLKKHKLVLGSSTIGEHITARGLLLLSTFERISEVSSERGVGESLEPTSNSGRSDSAHASGSTTKIVKAMTTRSSAHRSIWRWSHHSAVSATDVVSAPRSSCGAGRVGLLALVVPWRRRVVTASTRFAMFLAARSHLSHLLFEIFERVVKCALHFRCAATGDNLLSPSVTGDLHFVFGMAPMTGGVPGYPDVEKIVVSLIREGVNTFLDFSSLFVSYELRLVPMDLQVFSFPVRLRVACCCAWDNRYRNWKRCAGSIWCRDGSVFDRNSLSNFSGSIRPFLRGNRGRWILTVAVSALDRL